MNTLGQNIRLLRRQQGWSQEDAAVKMGISIPAFSKIETGVTDINLSRLEQVADIFGISAVQLLTLDDAQQQLDSSKLDAANQKLLNRDNQMMDLQKKVIELFEELRSSVKIA